MVTCEHCFEESGLREVVEAVRSVVLSHQEQYTMFPPMVVLARQPMVRYGM